MTPLPNEPVPSKPVRLGRWRTWVHRPRQSLSDMWQSGLDILEYLDESVVRDRVVRGAGRRRQTLRRALGFVLVAALLNAMFALAAGVLSGTAAGSFLRSVLDFLLTYALFTVISFLVGRLLGGQASFAPFVYATALYSVPLQVVQALLVVIASLIPVVGFYVLLLVILFSVAARILLSDLVTRAMMQFPRPWQRWVMFAVLTILAVLGSSWSLLG